MRKLLLLLFILPLLAKSQAIPGCGTFTASGAITASSNTTISGKIIDLGGAATVGITIPANAHDIHITKCIIKNSTALNGLIYIQTGAFNITIDTCFFEAGWRGIYGFHATNNLHIWNNYFHNISDPNVLTSHTTDGGGSSVQLNNCNGSSIQVLDNKSYHDVSGSGIGDQFSVYQCNGTSASPIRVCRNQALNGSTNIPANGYVGAVGGDVGGSWQRIDSNIFVNVGSVLAQIQGGTNIEMSYNTGFLAQTSYTSVGMAYGNYSGAPSNNCTMAFNNVRAIQSNGNVFNYWFDSNNVTAPAGWSSNTTSTSLNASILPNPLWPPCNPVVLPPNITYSPSTNVYTVGTSISSLVPVNTGGNITGFSVTPSLPASLGISSVSGIISGVPTVATPQATYTVKAVNSAGQSTFPLVITVNPAPVIKPNISYNPNSINVTVGGNVPTLSPSNTGGNVTGWGINPSLPSNLTFVNGVVSGQALVTQAQTSYTVSASNSSGTSTAQISVQINAQPPQAPHITYPASSYSLQQNTSITINPTNSGGVGTYSITSGSLPLSLSLNSQTGIISGSLTAIQSPSSVTITCSNGTGSSPFVISFAVNATPTNHFYLINNTWFGPIFY